MLRPPRCGIFGGVSYSVGRIGTGPRRWTRYCVRCTSRARSSFLGLIGAEGADASYSRLDHSASLSVAVSLRPTCPEPPRPMAVVRDRSVDAHKLPVTTEMLEDFAAIARRGFLLISAETCDTAARHQIRRLQWNPCSWGKNKTIDSIPGELEHFACRSTACQSAAELRLLQWRV